MNFSPCLLCFICRRFRRASNARPFFRLSDISVIGGQGGSPLRGYGYTSAPLALPLGELSAKLTERGAFTNTMVYPNICAIGLSESSTIVFSSPVMESPSASRAIIYV